MNNKSKVFSLLGLATRSRNLVSGEFMAEKAIRAGHAKLVIVAQDAADNTKKMFSDMCVYRKVPFFMYGNMTELGACIGKEFRASLVITDEGFASSVKKYLEETDNNTEVNK